MIDPSVHFPDGRLHSCVPQSPLHGFNWAGCGIDVPYIIFITGRCGSTLLTHLLSETGLCGTPDEFFNEEFRELRRRLDADSFPRYLHTIVKNHATNRRFGCQIDPFRFERLQAFTDFTTVFPPERTVFFWMTRRDLVAQAWSWAQAKRSGLWHLYADGEARADQPAMGNGSAVADHEWWGEVLLILRAEQVMEGFFADEGIVPHRLDYESLVADKARAVIRVLHALRCTPNEIDDRVVSLADRTVRQQYDGWRRALIRFTETYREELQEIERVRFTIDIPRMRDALIARYGLPL